MKIRHILATVLGMIIPIVSVRAASVADFPEIERYTGSEAIPAGIETWQYAPDGQSYLCLNAEGTRITRHNVKDGKETETVMDVTHTRETTLRSVEGFSLSPDGSKIIVYRNRRPIYRRSWDAEYYVYEIRTRLLKPLSVEHPRQQAPVCSPDGRMVAFVAGNDIFLKKLDYGTEVAVTKDGKKNEIINGVPDWTYEEEFSTSCSMAWAPDNLTLCYLKYNESQVPLFSFQLYEGSCDKMPQYALYPGEFTYKYPVAGQPNSKVTLHSYDVETRKTKNIPVNDLHLEYIPRIAYGPGADKLMVATLNRDQTRMELYSVNPRSAVVRSVLVEEWKAWLTPSTYENIAFLPDFFVVSSCRTGWQHLYVYSYTGQLLRTLTSGDYDVDQYYGYDAASGSHYYRSTQTGPLDRVICRVDAKGRTSVISPSAGTSTGMMWSPKMDYFVMSHSDISTPPVYDFCAALSGKSVRRLQDNADYARKWADAPKAEFFTMQSDGISLNGYIIKPSGFNPSKRYPVIMSQYSGPQSQQVLNRWMMGAENYFARAGYVVVCVDGRGTGGRGRAFCDVVYKRLGHFESIDQIAAAGYAASLPYVDREKIAIYGWSYGGYEAIMASSVPGAPFCAAVAVAPVTDWRYYDTVYAERYMLTPGQNEEGYSEASTLNKIADRTCPLLIITGTADDNVHMFNTIQYSSSAEAIGRWTDVVMFPNKNHSINGCNARQVVYARLLDYVATQTR